MSETIVQPVLDVTIVNEDSSTTVYTTDENLVVIEGKDDNIVVYEKDAPVIIETAGTQGPPGPPGEEVPYDKLVDFIDDDHAYIGECDPGGDEAAAVWRIRYVIFASDGDVSSKWANGTSDFDKIWNNRASYTY